MVVGIGRDHLIFVHFADNGCANRFRCDHGRRVRCRQRVDAVGKIKLL